jgi:hypothetical protein
MRARLVPPPGTRKVVGPLGARRIRRAAHLRGDYPVTGATCEIGAPRPAPAVAGGKAKQQQRDGASFVEDGQYTKGTDLRAASAQNRAKVFDGIGAPRAVAYPPYPRFKPQQGYSGNPPPLEWNIRRDPQPRVQPGAASEFSLPLDKASSLFILGTPSVSVYKHGQKCSLWLDMRT